MLAQKPDCLEYQRREPENTPCYQLVQQHLPAFIREREEEGRSLPSYVIKEFEAYLKCGIQVYGFLRLRCEGCHREKVVAFSCKTRGLGQTDGRDQRSSFGKSPAVCTLQAVCGELSVSSEVLAPDKSQAIPEDP